MQYVTYIGTRVIIIISCKLSNHIIIAYRTRTATSIITVYVVRIIQVYAIGYTSNLYEVNHVVRLIYKNI